MRQKKVLDRPVSSRDGTDLGVIADVTFRERLQAFHLEIMISWNQ